jgi:uncharacterized membrane protein required for colicin V production
VIAALTQSLSLNKLPVNWFDATVLAMLGFGLFRGRKNGMTKEVLPTSEWIVLILAAGFGYPALAQVYANFGLDKVWSAILAYLTVALLVFLIFSGIKKVLAPKLTGSNLFGSNEYYFGIPSGIIRYFCITIFVLALLNARFYSEAEIQARAAYNNRWYGGGESGFSGNLFVDLPTVQKSVFKNSFCGAQIKKHLDCLLIETGPGGPALAGSQNSSDEPQKKQPIIHIGK